MTLALRRSIQAGVLALALLIGASVLSAPHGPAPYALGFLVSGAAFVAAGVIAWSLRPANLVGLLMTAVGLGLLISAVVQDSSSQYAYLSAAVLPWLGGLWEVLLIHLLLVFPEGRLGSQTSRWLVAALYIFFVVGLFEIPTLLTAVVYPVFIFLTVALILRRWWLGGSARRRSLTPVLWSLMPIALAFLPSALLTFLAIAGVQIIGPITGLPGGLYNASPLLLLAMPAGFLIGLLRSGIDLTTVGSLVVKLSSGLQPEQLQTALAQALHDPSLEVIYWVPALDSFADLQGRHVQLPAPGAERAASVLGGETDPVAALVYDSSLLLEPELVDSAAAAARMALENAGLQAQLRAQLEEVRQSRARLVEAAQDERQRVERDLHDGAQQQLVTLLLSLQATRAVANRHADPETASMLDSNIATLKQALAELRELARGIYPSILTEAGLVPAARSLAERSPIPVEVRGDLGDVRLAPQLEATLYFVAAEAITNAIKHSDARNICVTMQRGPSTVSLEVSDDGRGGADLLAGTGLRGLSDRVAAVGGRLEVGSANGRGTRIHSEIPCV
jgi:signal transduction histidine kinase